MDFLKRSWQNFIIWSYILFTPISLIYADGETCEAGKICNPIKYNNFNDFIRILLTNLLKIAIPLIALAIIYSGFLFVSARGNPESLTKAKDALLYTLIGAAVLLGSWAIATLISNTVLSL